MTLIGDSNDASKALPSHFKVSMKATEKDIYRVKTKMITYVHYIRQTFSCHKEIIWPTTI